VPKTLGRHKSCVKGNFLFSQAICGSGNFGHKVDRYAGFLSPARITVITNFSYMLNNSLEDLGDSKCGPRGMSSSL